jgi:hypothetical protein
MVDDERGGLDEPFQFRTIVLSHRQAYMPSSIGSSLIHRMRRKRPAAHMASNHSM